MLIHKPNLSGRFSCQQKPTERAKSLTSAARFLSHETRPTTYDELSTQRQRVLMVGESLN